ncbi:glutathione S-transferase family protein [Pontibaca salina]|uniref:Glutathione S-transferase family protein n=1 Tax=Pontibaca salina TaxID=2795731 RepID=A0A934HMR3_9RHOB|nr:glutathione S-transferase family protein [Pontibaca salina]MBI6630933.1 glutathione S-transferase family protein [Pontibaca salina]
MTLHYAPGTIATTVAITLHESGLEHKTIRVDFANAEQTKAPYHRLNPKGRVPVLVTPQGVLTETGALLEHIAALAPQAGLVPTDPFAAAKMRETMYWLASTMHVNHAHRFRGSRWASQPDSFKDMAAKVPENMTENAAYVENHVLTGPYVIGDRLTLADPYLFTVCTWLAGDGVDVSPFPKLTTFMEIMENRASVRAVRAKAML